MESSEDGRVGGGGQKECVKVAVNIRPLITSELLLGCTDCVTVVSGEPQVQIGAHAFTYDHVYGSSGAPLSLLFEECVAPLVHALFNGYNATVLAYGQTGSGKTYTMGTNYTGDNNYGGVIPQVMEMIFKKVDTLKDTAEILLRVSFIEIFKEEVYDLLDSSINAPLKPEGPAVAKSGLPSRAPIQIRETPSGGITLSGVLEAEVRSKEEMASFLTHGSLSRATGHTNMNSQSSRSHAIFTISLEQKKNISSVSNGTVHDVVGDDVLFAKLHLVDLAGSERAKRTGADGLRLKEGIHINRGLLALGNVISALGDDKKRKEGGHVPYRDSKLTRLLQDSLGGNSKTVMIACISPADTNAEETINTLKYANRARNIQNKAVINRDPMAEQMLRMRNQLEQLQSELLYCHGGGALEELQVLRHRISLLEESNAELHEELKEQQITCQHLKQCALDAQVEKDKLILKIESARSRKSWDEIDDANNSQELDLVKSYAVKVQELESELLRAQNLSNIKQNGFLGCLPARKDTFLRSLHDLTPNYDDKSPDISSEIEEDEKEREHSSLQERLGKELQELNKRLEQKEAEMKQFSNGDTLVLKQHYERKLFELEQEKKAFQKEIEDLRFMLANISSVSDDSAKKLKEDYLQKLNKLETQVSELRKKQEAQSQLLRQKQKSDDAAKRLQDEIQRIKSHKVQLQNKIKQESEQFRSWRATREKEVLQLKKEGRRNEYEMHKLLALNQKQKMVLQRKTEEAAMATKRLKELLEARKASSREVSGPGNINDPGIQALMKTIEHELEVTVRVHEVRSEYERQMQERAAMAKEVAKLKEESEMLQRKMLSDCPQTMSPSARNSRISALENMLATSSTTLVTMASQLSEAEERERIFSGRGRWKVRSVVEAKNVMNHLFNIASLSRCQLRDKELQCREKELVINELKEKVFDLSSLVRQLEGQMMELQKQNLQLASKMNSKHIDGSLGTVSSNSVEDRHHYGLHKSPRASQTDSRSRNCLDFLEDMDISDSEYSDQSNSESDLLDEDWVASTKKMGRKRSKSTHPVRNNVEDAQVSDNIKMEILKEEPDVLVENNDSHVCCTCSKKASCKTRKCECRANGKICGLFCGCKPSKCANRASDFIQKERKDASSTEMSESSGAHSSSENLDKEKNIDLVSHATSLLQSALSEKSTVVNEDSKQRKPLSDIGNTAVKPNGAKPSRRKNWRKTVVQLVPMNPPPSSIPETYEAPSPRNDALLRLPRAMDSGSMEPNVPPFADRNSVKPFDSAARTKEAGSSIQPRSPIRLQKATDEKENHIV